MADNDKRKVVLYTGAEYINIDFRQINSGNIIRLFEPDGTSVKDKEGNFIFTAATNSYVNKNGILTFDTKYGAKSLDEIMNKIKANS